MVFTNYAESKVLKLLTQSNDVIGFRFDTKNYLS